MRIETVGRALRSPARSTHANFFTNGFGIRHSGNARRGSSCCGGWKALRPPAALLTPAVFHILLALADGEKHGYGIMKEVESLSVGQVRLALGTLYGALDRLVEKGIVEISREERTGGRLRRYYHLTDAGVDPFREETELQSRLVEVARMNLKSRRPVVPKPLEAS